MLALEHVQQLQPVEAGTLHPDVQEHQAGPAPGDFIQPAVGVMRLPGLEALVFKDARDQVANIVFVVDDQNIQCHYLCTTAASSGSSIWAVPASFQSAA